MVCGHEKKPIESREHASVNLLEKHQLQLEMIIINNKITVKYYYCKLNNIIPSQKKYIFTSSLFYNIDFITCAMKFSSTCVYNHDHKLLYYYQ